MEKVRDPRFGEPRREGIAGMEARRNEARYIFRRRGLNAPDITRRPILRPPLPPLFHAIGSTIFSPSQFPTGSRVSSENTPDTPVESPSFELPTLYAAICLPRSHVYSRGRDGCAFYDASRAKRMSESTLSTRIIHRALK